MILPHFMPQALPYFHFTVHFIGSWTQVTPRRKNKSWQSKSYLPEEREKGLPVDSCRYLSAAGEDAGGKDQEKGEIHIIRSVTVEGQWKLT